MDEFNDVLCDIKAMFDLKNADYGTSYDPLANVTCARQWGVPPWVAAMVRANDKVARLQKFAKDGVLANEGVEDSLLDLAVYSMIALVLWRKELDDAA